MKGWIKLHIHTYSEESYKLSELGIESDEGNTFKANLVQISSISSIGLEPEEEGGIIYIHGEPISTVETAEEIVKLIENNLNK